MTEPTESCVKPAKGPIATKLSDDLSNKFESKIVEERKMIARVGKPAPDFEAAAYQSGAFKNVRLSDLKGGWVVLCFYPGDFTFV
ncbi:MAG: hypothetical protein QG663_1788 [Thermodesulfobacteriota bacterium]|jgi:peroxiredoxin (alkyl hydroperoxide reductase subunit C)|nr:hypothetical protein [Thermodesulfobacteriota bacterium]